jgi:hypothetical protein
VQVLCFNTHGLIVQDGVEAAKVHVLHAGNGR